LPGAVTIPAGLSSQGLEVKTEVDKHSLWTVGADAALGLHMPAGADYRSAVPDVRLMVYLQAIKRTTRRIQ